MTRYWARSDIVRWALAAIAALLEDLGLMPDLIRDPILEASAYLKARYPHVFGSVGRLYLSFLALVFVMFLIAQLGPEERVGRDFRRRYAAYRNRK